MALSNRNKVIIKAAIVNELTGNDVENVDTLSELLLLPKGQQKGYLRAAIGTLRSQQQLLRDGVDTNAENQKASLDQALLDIDDALAKPELEDTP